MSDELPSFDRPPVVEVALGFYFETEPGLGSRDLVALSEPLRDEYPQMSERPAQPAPQALAPGEIQFSFSTAPNPPQFLLVAEDGEHAVQIQTDRLFANWTRRGGPEEYPRFKTIRPRFEEVMQSVTDALPATTALTPTIAEVEYVNIIELDDELSDPSQFSDVFNIVTPAIHAGVALSFSDASASLTYRIAHFDGRLTATFDNVLNLESGSRAFRFTLAARFPVSEVSDVSGRLNEGRAAIVQAFAALTTDRMHERWGLNP